MATFTQGVSPTPSDVALFMDNQITSTLANYKKSMTDQIGALNAVINKIMNTPGSYIAEDGGQYIQEPLMYALGEGTWYNSYDEFTTQPMDGVTSAQFDWANLAVPIVYDIPSLMKNSGKSKLIDIANTKIMQAEMGIQEQFAQAFMWGNVSNGGLLSDAYVDPNSSRTAIDPIGKLISYNTTTLTVGSVSESTNTWWRNRSLTSAATTYSAFYREILRMWNNCGLGTGGYPDMILCDQVTYELVQTIFLDKFKSWSDGGSMKNASGQKMLTFDMFVMDDKVGDVANNAIPTLIAGSGDAASLTKGSMYFVNTKFLKVRYMNGADFEMIKDDNGKAFAKPINGNSRVGHIGWMGNTTTNKRSKQGVIGNIARSLT